jgi:hypothetical protein
MDIRRDLSPEEMDEANWFPFVEVWSNRTAQEMFAALSASAYGGGVQTIPKFRISFDRSDFQHSIPDRFRNPIPQFTAAILTHDVDNKDYRLMNAVGEFFMEDLRLSSSKRNFRQYTPIETWDRDKEKILELARRKNGPNASAYDIRNSVFSYTQESNPFRPTIALAVYSIFNAKSILDMSAGWGDRLIGALAWASRSGLSIRYQGYDPFADLQPRYRAMIAAFGQETSRFEVTCSPFEEAPIEENEFDLAFTSPPYFDFEEYGITDQASARQTQSTVRFPDLKQWVDKFLKPTMQRASLALRKGGHLALNIEGPFMHNVLQDSQADGLNMEYVGILAYHSDNPKDKTSHPIFVWRKL